MKIKFTLMASICICGLILLFQQGRTEDQPNQPVEERDESEVNMEEQEDLIRDSLQMAPSLDLVLENGVDPIMQAIEDGNIIDVTLEEVVQALEAAALTPETDDDVAALEMKHRGSYRFFPVEQIEPAE